MARVAGRPPGRGNGRRDRDEPVKEATPELVRTVTSAITNESTIPVPAIPMRSDFADSMRRFMRPVVCRPAAKSAATKVRSTTLVSMLPMPLKNPLSK